MNYAIISLVAFVAQILYLLPSRFSMIDYAVILSLTLIIVLCERRIIKTKRRPTTSRRITR